MAGGRSGTLVSMQELRVHPVIAALADVAVEEAGDAGRLTVDDAAILLAQRAGQIAQTSDLDLDGVLTQALRPSVVRGMVRLITVAPEDPRTIGVPVPDVGRVLADVGQVARLALPSGGSEFPHVGMDNLLGDISLELGNGIAAAEGRDVAIRLPTLADIRTAFTVALDGIAAHGWRLDLEDAGLDGTGRDAADALLGRMAAAFSAQILRCDALAGTL